MKEGEPAQRIRKLTDVLYFPIRNKHQFAEFRFMHIEFLTRIYHIQISFSTYFQDRWIYSHLRMQIHLVTDVIGLIPFLLRDRISYLMLHLSDIDLCIFVKCLNCFVHMSTNDFEPLFINVEMLLPIVPQI
jgi:hypothetical protein